MLQPSGLAALRWLGLADEVIAAGAPIHRLHGLEGGHRIMDMRYADWRAGTFGVGVHRANLFGVLYAAVRAGGLEVRTGCDVVGFDGLDQPILIDARGGRHGPFDLVVVADGSGSRLRGLLRPRARATPYRWGAVWANADDGAGEFDGTLHQRYHGCDVMIGVLPIGRAPTSKLRQVSFFWSLPVAEMDRLLASDLGEWRSRVEGLWPDVARIVRQIGDASVLSKAIYRDVSVGRWRRGAFILIGDAAHGTSPQLGQGANLALLDAVELGLRVVGAADVRPYELARRRQTAVYQMLSRGLTPLFQSRSRMWAFVRRWFFAPPARWPILRNLSALVLTGSLRLGPTPPELRL